MTKLIQQKYPATIIKVGTVLYRYDAYSYDDGSSTVELQEWHVRSIKRKRGSQTRYGCKSFRADSEYSLTKYVNITQKINGVTWGKLSRKNGDFGFYKSISETFRLQFAVGSPLPHGIFTTQLAALRYAVKSKEKSIQRLIGYQSEETDPEEVDLWQEDIDLGRKELKLLKSRLTKMKNRK